MIEVSGNTSPSTSFETRALTLGKYLLLEAELHPAHMENGPYCVARWNTRVSERDALSAIGESYTRLRSRYLLPVFKGWERFEEPFIITMSKDDAQLSDVSPQVSYEGVDDVLFNIVMERPLSDKDLLGLLRNSPFIPDEFYWVKVSTPFCDYYVDGFNKLKSPASKEVKRKFAIFTDRYIPAELMELYETTSEVRLSQEDLWELHTQFGKLTEHLPPLEVLAAR